MKVMLDCEGGEEIEEKDQFWASETNIRYSESFK